MTKKYEKSKIAVLLPWGIVFIFVFFCGVGIFTSDEISGISQFVSFSLFTGILIGAFYKAEDGFYTGLVVNDNEVRFIGILNQREKLVWADKIHEVTILAHSKKSAIIKCFYEKTGDYLSQTVNVSDVTGFDQLIEEVRDFTVRNGIDRTEILKKNLTGDKARIVEEINFEKAGVEYNRSRDYFDNKPGFLDFLFAGFILVVIGVGMWEFPFIWPVIKMIVIIGSVGLMTFFYKKGYDLLFSALFTVLSPVFLFLLLGAIFLFGEKLIQFITGI
jgi:hypothetical protein